MDHLRLNLRQPDPIKGTLPEAFKVERDRLAALLNNVPYRTHDEIFGNKPTADSPAIPNP